MLKRLLPLLGVVLVVGCGQSPNPQNRPAPEPEKMGRVEVPIGDVDYEAAHLPFRITKVSTEQKQTEQAPFHAPGGEWTFLDCETLKAPKATFTVGVMTKQAAGGTPSAWGRALLVVNDKATGTRLLELLAKAFGGKVPTPTERAFTPVPLVVSTAVLGEGMQRERMGGFNAEPGGWTATKWFPQIDGLEAEVYFNFNLQERIGEFSEKDADYADDLVAVFATTLRDGPRPERTPDNDPNLTLVGPKIGQPRKLLSRIPSYQSFSPAGRFVVYQSKVVTYALPVDPPNEEPVEIAHFDFSPWEVHVLNDDLDLLVQEGIPERPNMRSSADPMRIWWIDQKKKDKKLLRGPEKDLGLVESPVSPDLRYVALDQWRDKPDGKRGITLMILDRETGTIRDVESLITSVSVIGWKKTDDGLRAVAVSNRWGFERGEVPETYHIDPASGKSVRQDKPDQKVDPNEHLSPDGKYRAHTTDDELILVDVSTGDSRHFVFHEEDRRFLGPECIEWASPRYLKFNGQRLSLIDVTTMKMSFPVLADGAKLGSNLFTFSPDFLWVMYAGENADGEGLYLAPVQMPEE